MADFYLVNLKYSDSDAAFEAVRSGRFHGLYGEELETSEENGMARILASGRVVCIDG